ncbi:MAG: signal peptidase I, partial [Propionibacteriaceae bacterium]|nr:signal peptidase I [Propionibacteriaceae bacterium]
MLHEVNDERRVGVWRRLYRSPWFNLLVAVVVLALVQGFLVKVYQVPSGSMEPTLQVGDRMLVNRLAYVGDGPEPGDVVVFAEPDDWRPSGPVERGLVRTVIGWVGTITGIGPSNTTALVKRVIAGPGQTLSCCDDEGQSLLDDVVLSSPE